MGFLAFLLPLLSQLPGAIGKYFEQRNELEAARIEAARQLEVAKQQLAMETAKAQLELNKTIVSSTGSYFKYFTFIMWFGPFIVGIIAPKMGMDIFNNLKLMPEWYVQSCMLIMFTVWGISVSAPVISNIFSGLSDFFISQRKAGLNRKLFYDTLRSVKGNISQAEVDLYEKAITHMSKDE